MVSLSKSAGVYGVLLFFFRLRQVRQMEAEAKHDLEVAFHEKDRSWRELLSSKLNDLNSLIPSP